MPETMKLQISLSASKLKNVAGTFKGVSDPFAVVTLLGNKREDKPRIIGKTEVLKNTLSPDWTTTFQIDYELGQPANLLVKVFDEVKKGDNIPMGSAIFEVGAVLGAKGNSKAKKMKNGGGQLYVKVEKTKESDIFKLRMSGIKLKNTEGFMRKSDPFYQITKKDEGLRGSTWKVVHRSTYIKNNLDPTWPVEELDMGVLCNDDPDAVFLLSVYDNESSGDHVLMGQVETSVNGLIAAKSSSGFELTKKGKKTGTLAVHVAEIKGASAMSMEEKMNKLTVTPSAPPLPMPTGAAPVTATSIGKKPTFMDYISGGCEINLSVAIDFTGSNGDPRKPGTLHHFNADGSKNDYEKAISAIGNILADYDSDKQFPVWGFGAKYGGMVRHCFQCGPTAEVEGVEGILQAYRDTFKSGLVMSGPTVFTEVIQTAAAHARSAQEEAAKNGMQKYSILLILTDGAVSDVGATARCIDAIDDSPLSIVIVGIGRADFSSMQFLDDKSGDIDIAQFVEFDRHRHHPTSLTNATLQEVPQQLESYFLRHGVMPNPPIQLEDEEIVIEAEEEEIDLTIDFDADGSAVGVNGGGDGKNVFVPPGAY